MPRYQNYYRRQRVPRDQPQPINSVALDQIRQQQLLQQLMQQQVLQQQLKQQQAAQDAAQNALEDQQEEPLGVYRSVLTGGGSPHYPNNAPTSVAFDQVLED